jgi:hypothetical protein
MFAILELKQWLKALVLTKSGEKQYNTKVQYKLHE